MAWARAMRRGGRLAWELASTDSAWDTSRSVASPFLKRERVSFSTCLWDWMFLLVAARRSWVARMVK